MTSHVFEGLNNKPAVLQALADVEADVDEFFRKLTSNNFVLRVGDAWTPAEHLAHLNTAVSAVARGFGTRRWMLALRFGKTKRPSRSFEQMREFYRQRLANGGRASGGFVPARADATSGDTEELREVLLARWQRVNARLRTAVEPWPENDLHRIQLPHPLIGKITAHDVVIYSLSQPAPCGWCAKPVASTVSA